MCVGIFFKEMLSAKAYFVNTHPRTADIRAKVRFEVLTDDYDEYFPLGCDAFFAELNE
jgi:hypothetical protein